MIHRLVECPPAKGRGAYCLHANDDMWEALSVAQPPCDYCEGCAGVGKADVADYDPHLAWPAFPYQLD